MISSSDFLLSFRECWEQNIFFGPTSTVGHFLTWNFAYNSNCFYKMSIKKLSIILLSTCRLLCTKGVSSFEVSINFIMVVDQSHELSKRFQHKPSGSGTSTQNSLIWSYKQPHMKRVVHCSQPWNKNSGLMTDVGWKWENSTINYLATQTCVFPREKIHFKTWVSIWYNQGDMQLEYNTLEGVCQNRMTNHTAWV